MIIAASFAIKKVREGAKNMFAYVLLSLTVLLGIAYVGLSLV
jgi:heme/copper-type cytochrome/quinol oxidase subunit 3